MPSPILLTVDVELSNLPGTRGLWGQTPRGEYGLRFILEWLAELDIPATFFVDVYGGTEETVSEQRAACEAILAAGQDCQLHTHPGPSFDAKRPRLNQYNRDEQREILEFGLARL